MYEFSQTDIRKSRRNPDSEGKICNDYANFDTFIKLGMVEESPKDWKIDGRQV